MPRWQPAEGPDRADLFWAQPNLTNHRLEPAATDAIVSRRWLKRSALGRARGGTVYIWRIEGLKKQLAVRALTDREILPYVVASGGVWGLGFAIPPENPNGLDTVLGLVTALLTVLGTLWVYRQNGGPAGRDFLQRSAAIGWVVFVRLLPAVLLAGVVMFLMKGAPLEGALQTTSFDVLLFAVLVAAYYERVGAHVRQVARALPDIEQTAAAD